ncbi:MAG: hypothetical protein ACYTXT_41095 [Nostoc sp.]
MWQSRRMTICGSQEKNEIDNGDAIKEGRYSVAVMSFDVADPYHLKPSPHCN